MRQAQVSNCKRTAKFPNGRKYSGAVEYQGRQRWVGTFPTRSEWEEAAIGVMADLREDLGDGDKPRVPTVAEFVRVVVEPDGRVIPASDGEPMWPWTHPRKIRKESSFRVMAENIRPFVRRHGQRPVDSFTRPQAREIARTMPNHQKAALRRLFGDIVDDDYIPGNPFTGMTVKQLSRLERNDFSIVTADELERLLDAALASRADDFGRTLRAMVLLEATIGIRPSEIFGLEWSQLDRDEGCLYLEAQIDPVTGEVISPKNGRSRLAPLTGELLAAIDAAPRLSERWIFPAPRGGALTLSGWHPYWNAIRVAARMPALEFYELKHRAITWMCTPSPDGLGLSHVDAALIVGHTDGGATIRKHYLRLDEKQALTRFRSAESRFVADRARCLAEPHLPPTGAPAEAEPVVQSGGLVRPDLPHSLGRFL